MKKILFLVALMLGTLVSQAQEIKWMTLNEALAAQKKNPKPIFMDVYTDWCGPCKMLDKNTFHDPAVVKYVNENYYAVKFNGEGKEEVTYKGNIYGNPNYVEGRTGRNGVHTFTMFLKVQGYPSMYIFDKKGELQNPIVGYHTPEQLLPMLKEQK